MRLWQATAGLTAVLAALPFAVAQVRTPAADSEATPAPTARSSGALPSRAFRDADARHCLELTTNPEVIVCAEKYRPHARRP